MKTCCNRCRSQVMLNDFTRSFKTSDRSSAMPHDQKPIANDGQWSEADRLWFPIIRCWSQMIPYDLKSIANEVQRSEADHLWCLVIGSRSLMMSYDRKLIANDVLWWFVGCLMITCDLYWSLVDSLGSLVISYDLWPIT